MEKEPEVSWIKYMKVTYKWWHWSTDDTDIYYCFGLPYFFYKTPLFLSIKELKIHFQSSLKVAYLVWTEQVTESRKQEAEYVLKRGV